MRIDFTEVRNVLANVDRLLVQHHDQELHNHRGNPLSRRQDDKAALLADDLQAMQDYLQLAGAEIAAVYWQANGREDPRVARNHRWPLAQASGRDTNSFRGTSPRYLDEHRQTKTSRPSAAHGGQ
jgi:hypothetical protein